MEEVKEAVEETAGNAAASEGVESTVSSAPETDPETLVASLREELKEVSRDRDNYRKVALAAKGKAELDDLDVSDPVQLKAYIDKSVHDKLLETKEFTARRQLEDTAVKLAKKNKELTLALQSKKASTSIAGGAGAGGAEAEKSASKNSYWSPEQIADLKRRGWDEARIKRAEEIAKSGAATAPSIPK